MFQEVDVRDECPRSEGAKQARIGSGVACRIMKRTFRQPRRFSGGRRHVDRIGASLVLTEAERWFLLVLTGVLLTGLVARHRHLTQARDEPGRPEEFAPDEEAEF